MAWSIDEIRTYRQTLEQARSNISRARKQGEPALLADLEAGAQARWVMQRRAMALLLQAIAAALELADQIRRDVENNRPVRQAELDLLEAQHERVLQKWDTLIAFTLPAPGGVPESSHRWN
jgi:hypothetical protein